jgi:hypothetical protein
MLLYGNDTVTATPNTRNVSILHTFLEFAVICLFLFFEVSN